MKREINRAIQLLLENGYGVFKVGVVSSAPAAPAAAPDSPRMLRLPDVLKKTGLTRSALYTLMGQRQFPRPVKLGKRAVGWHSEVVDAWLALRLT